MEDSAKQLFARVLAEPFKTKMVERIHLPDRAERERILRDAFYSPAYVKAEDVCIDLVTDSGTGAMSDDQWSALMRGDEAYVWSKSFAAFESAVREAVGFRHVIPTHQGRAAENIVMELMLKPNDLVLSNNHFDTTRAHVEHRKAVALDLVGDGVFDFRKAHPFKGDIDLERLQLAIGRYRERIAMIILTVVNNLACSSPVSMANIRETSRIAKLNGIPFFIDACRFAENAFFIKTREAGYKDASISQIALEMMSYADGCWMSTKKDGISNIGGFIATNDEHFARRCQEKLVLYEGFYTYGGLARRDLEAIAVGLREGLDESYLAHRVGLVAYLGERLEEAGLVVSTPTGGSGVFVDLHALYPQLKPKDFPGIALFSDFYREGGIRVGSFVAPVRTLTAQGEMTERPFQLARFAIPRRVYGKGHVDYVAEIAREVKAKAQSNRGYRVVEMPDVLGHFFAKFAPIESPARKQ